MSFFYKRDELAFRTGLFISAAPLATSFASSLAWVITRIGTKIPIASWRLLFLVEGFPSIIVSFFVFLYIPDNPQSARYLTPREHRVAQLRLRTEKSNQDKGNGKRGLQWREIARTLIDPKSYLTALMFFCANVAFSSLPVFLPTIIEEMGYTALQSQALSAPPYLVAFVSVSTSTTSTSKPQPPNPQLTQPPPKTPTNTHPPSGPSNSPPLRPPPHPLPPPHHPRPPLLPRLHPPNPLPPPPPLGPLHAHLPHHNRILLHRHPNHNLDHQQPTLRLLERNWRRPVELYRTIRPVSGRAFVSGGRGALLCEGDGGLCGGYGKCGGVGGGVEVVVEEGE